MPANRCPSGCGDRLPAIMLAQRLPWARSFNKALPSKPFEARSKPDPPADWPDMDYPPVRVKPAASPQQLAPMQAWRLIATSNPFLCGSGTTIKGTMPVSSTCVQGPNSWSLLMRCSPAPWPHLGQFIPGRSAKPGSGSEVSRLTHVFAPLSSFFII